MSKLNFDVLGVGAWGPGFQNWSQLTSLLQNQELEQIDEEVAALLKKGPKPEIIPANERRRAPLPVRLAVESSWQACQHAGFDPAKLPSVFVSGIGDTQLTDYMCRALAGEKKALSPTKFHNSVHNAAAGYWTISTGCMRAANSIAGYEQSVSLSLLEALLQSHAEQKPILLTVYDAPCSDVLQELIKNQQSFAVSMVIAPITFSDDSKLGLCKLSMKVENQTSEWPKFSSPNKELQQCYQENPSAKILSLMKLIASSGTNDSLTKTINLPLSAATSLAVSAS